MTIEPMLASAIDWDKIPTKCAGYTMEPKLDGVRCIADMRGPKGKLWSRGGKELTEKLPELVSYLESHCNGLVLDGELGYGNTTLIDFNKTMRVLGSGPDEARRKHLTNRNDYGEIIRFFVFDILVQGETRWHQYQQNDRRKVLESVADLLYWPNFVAEHGDLPSHPVVLCPSRDRFDPEYYTHIVMSGGEGVILKNPVAPYHSGKRRANSWYKVKAFESIDVQVLGYTEALPGKFEGQIGAIIFGHRYFVGETLTGQDELGKCSGMDDATRLDITANKEKYIGKWFELRHFGRVGSGGQGYRFPQFLRWRTDKDI